MRKQIYSLLFWDSVLYWLRAQHSIIQWATQEELILALELVAFVLLDRGNHHLWCQLQDALDSARHSQGAMERRGCL